LVLLTHQLTEHRAALSTLFRDFLFDIDERWKPTDSAWNVPAWTAQKEPSGHYFKRPFASPVNATRDLLPIEFCHEKILHKYNATEPVLENRFLVFQCFH
jgi:hypothetical protein